MQIESVHESDIVGSFGRPDGERAAPGVLALGGSSGGVPEMYLRLLVAEGFACLALEYFGSSRTQLALTEVPLERVERGIQWLLNRPDVDAPDGRVAIVGGSKGGELALLAAATFPELVGPVVAYTPSSVVWAGIDFNDREGLKRSSWSRGGQPLPFVPYPAGVAAVPSSTGLRLRPIYDAGLDNTEAVGGAGIEVEHATGPLLLISGGDDRMWPADRMSRMVVGRMRDHGRASDVRHLNYPDAGHVLTPYPPMPAGVGSMATMFDLGGSPDLAQAAHLDAWPQVLSHLRSPRV